MISKYEFRIAYLWLAIFLTCFPTVAQTDDVRYQIITNDGNLYHGFIVKKEAQFIQFQTDKIGVITIQFDDIRKIERIEGNSSSNAQSNVYYRDPSAVREPSFESNRSGPKTYFAKPSSFGLKKGEAYYQNQWIFVNQINVGITDYFSLGIGGVLLPVGDPGIPIWVTPKFTVPIIKDKVNWGIGSLNGLLMETEAFGFGFLYTDIGIGSEHNHISVGLGTTYEDGYWLEEPVFTLSGALRLSRNTSITTENYVTQINSFYSIHAYQYLSDQVVLQWGMLFVSDQYDTYPIPLLGLVVPIKVKL